MQYKLQITALLSILATTQAIFAVSNEFLNNSKDGYYFYRQQEPDSNITKPKSRMPKIPKDLTSLTPKEFEKLLEDVKGVAVMEGTDEDLETYIKLQNFAMSQSVKFQKKWKDVILNKPELNIALDNPNSTYSRGIIDEEKETQRKKYFSENGDRFGLMVFVQNTSDQRYKKTKAIMDTIKKEYGISFSFVSIEENPDVAIQRGIKSVPDVWLIYRDGKNTPYWNRVATGLVVKTDIMDNIEHVIKRVLKPVIDGEQ